MAGHLPKLVLKDGNYYLTNNRVVYGRVVPNVLVYSFQFSDDGTNRHLLFRRHHDRRIVLGEVKVMIQYFV